MSVFGRFIPTLTGDFRHAKAKPSVFRAVCVEKRNALRLRLVMLNLTSWYFSALSN